MPRKQKSTLRREARARDAARALGLEPEIPQRRINDTLKTLETSTRKIFQDENSARNQSFAPEMPDLPDISETLLLSLLLLMEMNRPAE